MPDISKQIIVGVDDDFRVRESLISLLESAGYEPLVFPSAEDFLKSGALARASCLITDFRMPGIDGIALQQQVRVHRPDLPVIFISAHIDNQVERQVFEGGAIRLFHKPFDAADLLRAIACAVR